MNKSDLIDHISKSAEVSKQAADRALSATLDGIRQALKKGKVVQIIGFGTFSVGRRAGELRLMASCPPPGCLPLGRSHEGIRRIESIRARA